MLNNQPAKTRTNKFLFITALIVLIGAAVLGVLYAKYAQSESREMVSDIPGSVINAKPPQNTPTASPVDSAPATTPPASDSALPPATVTPPATPPATPRNPTAVISGFEGRRASGDVTIITTTEGTFIRLEDNFDSSRAAPDNRVYLGNAQGRQIEISKLKAPSGGQNFRIPNGVNIRDYTYVWIHCKAYNTTYGSGQIVF